MQYVFEAEFSDSLTLQASATTTTREIGEARFHESLKKVDQKNTLANSQLMTAEGQERAERQGALKL